MQEKSENERDLVIEINAFSKLKLLTSAPTAVKERLFSALKILKTYIRSTTDDTHFENFIVLHIHRDFTDKINLKNIAAILFKALNLVKDVS